MTYALLGLTVFVAVLAALLVYMAIDLRIGSRREDNEDDVRPLQSAVGFVASREDWKDPD